MKVISKLLVVLFVLVGVAVPAAAQLCEPGSEKMTGVLATKYSCTSLRLDGLARILQVGSLLFEESGAGRRLEVRVAGVTSSLLKSGDVDRRVTLMSIEWVNPGYQSGVAITTQYELRAGESLETRTLNSSRKIYIVGITHRDIVLSIR